MPRPTRVCRLPTCDEVLKPYVRIPLCPECRATIGSAGAGIALGLAVLYHVAMRWL